MNYLLSIYIPTYNRASEVARQISFLTNEVKDVKDEIEIVVSNNCSEDNTEEVLEPFFDRIKYHRNNENLGISGNLYILENFVQGKYIWIIGDDDYLNAGIVKHVVQLLKKHEGINLIFLNFANLGCDNKKYQAASGYIENAGNMLTENFKLGGEKLTFSSSCIYKKEFWITTTQNLPFNDLKRYGCNFYAAMAAACAGGAYFDEKIWIHNSPDVSWKNIIMDTRKGSLRAYADLNKVGYSTKQIRNIYRQTCTRDFIGARVTTELLKRNNFIQMMDELLFLFRWIPFTVLKSCIQVLIYPIKNGIKIKK